MIHKYKIQKWEYKSNWEGLYFGTPIEIRSETTKTRLKNGTWKVIKCKNKKENIKNWEYMT